MLLEMALAEFPHELEWNVTTESPQESPMDSPPRQSYRSDSSSEERRHTAPSSSSTTSQVSGDGEEEHLRSQEMAATRKATLIRCSSEQFYGQEAAVPFQWEASPGKPMMVHEVQSFGRSSHPDPLPLPLPPAFRPIAIAGGRSVCNVANGSPSKGGVVGPLPLPPALRHIATASGRSVSNVASPTKGGVGGKVKSILGGKGPRNVKEDTFLPERVASDISGRAREDVDRDLIDSSDDGDAASPVSTLDLPMSPLTPSCSPQQGHENIRRQGHALDQARSTNYWTNTIMSEELPAVIEEDEGDLESVYGYHTMEFQAQDSPSSSGDRRDWTPAGREIYAKSLSAPGSRQNSSLRPAAANRGRRRSDFDWPEDFEERPEEVVKEVDESLWAFSPVASTFVFSGNGDKADSDKNSSLGIGDTGAHTPSGSKSPVLGYVLEHISFRKSLARSASSKPNYGLKPSSDAEYASQGSSRLRHHSVNGDDDYVSSRGHPMKRSYSCLPFFSLCGTQRPAAISFSQRLGPTLSNLHN